MAPCGRRVTHRRYRRCRPARARLSPPTLGRTAPARDDRHGRGEPPVAADRRRAYDRTRCAPSRRKCWTCSSELREKFSLAMLFISHDLAVVSQVSHRIGVMYAGSLVEMGTAQEVFTHPAHPYTRGLLHSVPTLRTERSQPLRTIEGTVPAITALPPGCAFEPRCSSRIDACSLAAAAAGRSCARPSGPLSGCVRGGPLTDAPASAQRHSCQPGGDGGVPRRRSPYDMVVNLGDVVGYNASPNEVCERVRAMGGPVVRGNHDRACTGLTGPVRVQPGGGDVGALDPDHAGA